MNNYILDFIRDCKEFIYKYILWSQHDFVCNLNFIFGRCFYKLWLDQTFKKILDDLEKFVKFAYNSQFTRINNIKNLASPKALEAAQRFVQKLENGTIRRQRNPNFRQSGGN